LCFSPLGFNVNICLARRTLSLGLVLEDAKTLVANKGHVHKISRFEASSAKVYLVESGQVETFSTGQGRQKD
jgi:hypothetical protein